MRRRVLILTAAILAASISVAGAQYNQFPGVQPPVPSPNSPPPPMIAPGPAAPSAMPRTDQPRSQLVPRRGGRLPVEVPRGDNDSFGDRATRCMHYGGAAGVSAKEIGRFTRECAN
jgi:hypothetical protein